MCDRPALRRPGTPTDEAWIESLNGHLKGEYPHLLAIRDPATLRAELEITRAHYNGIRLHQGIGYVTQNDEHQGRGEAIRKARNAGLETFRLRRLAGTTSPPYRSTPCPGRDSSALAARPARRTTPPTPRTHRLHVGQQPGSGAGHDTCPSAVAVIGGRVVVACTIGVPSSPGGSDLQQAQNPKQDRRFLRSTHVSRHHDQIVTATPGLASAGGNHFAIGVAKALHSAAHNGKG